MGIDVILELLRIFTHFEKVRFFFGFAHRSAAVGAASVYQLRLGEERLARNAVPAFVLAFINVALFVQLRKDFLNHFLVLLVGGADEMVVTGSDGVPDLTDLRRDIVDVLLRRNAFFFGQLLDFLPVFIGAG